MCDKGESVQHVTLWNNTKSIQEKGKSSLSFLITIASQLWYWNSKRQCLYFAIVIWVRQFLSSIQWLTLFVEFEKSTIGPHTILVIARHLEKFRSAPTVSPWIEWKMVGGIWQPLYFFRRTKSKTRIQIWCHFDMDEVTETIPKIHPLWMKPCHINPYVASPLQWLSPFRPALLKIRAKRKRRRRRRRGADRLQNFRESRVGGAAWKTFTTQYMIFSVWLYVVLLPPYHVQH